MLFFRKKQRCWVTSARRPPYTVKHILMNMERRHMDKISQINRERWNALAQANVEWSRPYLDYTPEQAAAYVGRHGVLKEVNGKRVLCLASGGGQDSVAFGLLGAEVTE
jgi:hypothetical protein